MMPTIKQQLYDLCHLHCTHSVDIAIQAIEDAREAMKNETKSSAGDKYETAREMMQQEIDINQIRISELYRQRDNLSLIDPAKTTEIVQNGSIVKTSQGNYYVGVSIGKLVVDKIPYYTLTSSAPLGARLMGLKKGDTFTFNGRMFVILDVS